MLLATSPKLSQGNANDLNQLKNHTASDPNVCNPSSSSRIEEQHCGSEKNVKSCRPAPISPPLPYQALLKSSCLVSTAVRSSISLANPVSPIQSRSSRYLPRLPFLTGEHHDLIQQKPRSSVTAPSDLSVFQLNSSLSASRPHFHPSFAQSFYGCAISESQHTSTCSTPHTGNHKPSR